MRLYIQIIFTVSVALLFADQAYALGPAECNAYADEAMEQAQASKTLGCGFTGDQWGSYREGHLRWCRSADRDSVFKERLARTKLLEMCTPCADYADTALAKQRENLLYSCGGTGNRWSFNRAGHFYFCMATFQPGAGPPTPGLQAGSKLLAAIGSVAYQEQTAREASIASCKAKYNETEITKCTIYADQAVQAVQRLASTRPDLCGMRLDGRWSANRDQHFAWCIQKLRTPFEGEIQSEAEGRANDQKSCEDGSVEYGGRAAVGGSGGSTLRPEPSSGLSPFNAGKQIDAKPEIPSAGTAVSGKPMKEMGSRRASTAKVGTNTGGAYTVRASKKPASGSSVSSSAVEGAQRKISGGNGSAMDRLGGDGTGSNTGGGASAERNKKPSTGGAVSSSGISKVKGPDAAVSSGGAKNSLPQFRLQPSAPTSDPRTTPR